MELEIYNSLEEKLVAFKSCGYLVIDSVEQFERWLNTVPRENKLFRGVNEAKYKIYTSAQRLYITNDLDKSGKKIEDFIQDELNQVKEINGGLLKKYFQLLNVVDHDLLYLSFLQHYSGVSPLIDFSANVEKALYFMQDGCSFGKMGSTGIDNYFSLYAKEYPAAKGVNKLSDDDLREFFSFSTMSAAAKSIVFQSQQINRNQQNRSSFANLNIVAQDGRFLFYSDGINPLEEDLTCVDIHKSLAPYIKKKLEEKGITKDSIYPQEEIIAKMALQRALENI
ncbi:MAG: FRG domain-containing protein [Fibrobacter sp.]|nr:FRG domain-containing protein [Fibrobacter sp.]